MTDTENQETPEAPEEEPETPEEAPATGEGMEA
jgi:hypothetical protein